MKIPLASTGLRDIDIAAAEKVLKSGNLTMGGNVSRFEEMMASYLGVAHFVMVNSGSSANLAIFEALLRPSKGKPYLNSGDGVLVPAVAWPTTIWPVVQLGLRPVFVDVEPDTIAIDLDKAERAIGESEGIKAIFPIHPLGYAIDDIQLEKFCKDNNLIQVNDVCESLGSWKNEKHAGVSGLASSFSFYFSHHITTMEGGGIATNDNDFADDLRAIRSHGWSRDRHDVNSWSTSFDDDKSTDQVSPSQKKFQFVSTGYNIRPMEIQAAIGIEQLKDIDIFVEKRRSIAKYVKERLENTCFEVVDGGTLDNPLLEKNHSWMLLCIRINKPITSHERLEIEELLEKYQIESRPVLTGNFLNQPALKRMKDMPPASDFPVAQDISTNYFMVGAHHDLSQEQKLYLGNSLQEIANSIQ